MSIGKLATVLTVLYLGSKMLNKKPQQVEVVNVDDPNTQDNSEGDNPTFTDDVLINPVKSDSPRIPEGGGLERRTTDSEKFCCAEKLLI